MEYKKQFKNIEIIRDDTNGAVHLSLVERHNSDRKTKIANNFISQLKTLDANVLHQVIKTLDQKLPKHQSNEKIVGLASSGVPMATALAIQRGSNFCFSTSGEFGNLSDVFFFSEDHRDDKKHYIYGLEKGDSVIIVENEVSSGLGLTLLIKALRKFDVDIISVCTVIEVINFNARALIEEELGFSLISLISLKLS